MELATLDELHRKKYVSEEEYERLLKGLRAKYAKLRGDEVQRESDALAESGRKRLDAARESVSGRDIVRRRMLRMGAVRTLVCRRWLRLR